MGKIKLNNGQELEIIADGVMENGDVLSLGISPADKTILDIERLMEERTNTEKIQLLDYNGDIFKVYPGYTVLKRIEKQLDAVVGYSEPDENGNYTSIKGVVIVVELMRPDETESRIAALEETVDTLVLESLGLK